MPTKEWLSKPENKERQRINKKKWYNKNGDSERSKAKVRQSKRREDFNKFYYDYKSKLSCEICGFSHPASLDFHHLNPDEKEFSINETRNYTSISKFLSEIKKCIVLCANCHRMHHYNIHNKIEINDPIMEGIQIDKSFYTESKYNRFFTIPQPPS